MNNSEEQLVETKELLLLLAGNFADDLALAEPNPIQRTVWIVYALKGLEDTSTQSSYEEMLKELQNAVSARLENGSW